MTMTDSTIKLQPGLPWPLGSSVAGKYYNFAAFLPQARDCKLHVYQKKEQEAAVILSLFAHSEYPGIFTGQIEKGQLDALGAWGYLYEIDGQLLADPYAKKTYGREQYGVAGKVLSAVYQESFAWEDDRHPRHPYQDMILYKLHVRGFTMTAPGVRHKGTYLGLAEKADYLTGLGVNAVLLFPCVEFSEMLEKEDAYAAVPAYIREAVQSHNKSQKKNSKEDSMAVCGENIQSDGKIEETPAARVNYWGYAEQNQYFVPKASYASKPEKATTEFKQLVKALHARDIEVLLEMNFTPETNPELIVDSLIWWVREYHVDGFRINKACVPEKLIARHPYLAGTKLLTEGMDTGWIYGGAVPEYPNLAEYNMGYAEDLRRYIKGDEEMVGRVAERLERQAGAQGIINFIADNNGFTLADLYSYDVKHNEANGEENRDGTDYNYSWNCGEEGKNRKKKIVKLRRQMQKNALTMLFLSQGTPMLLAGDEFGNSQQGNNNAYCQDNEIGWVSWKEMRANRELYEFVKMLIKLRREHPVLHNKIGLRGMDYISCGCPDSSRHGTKAWYPDYSNYSRAYGWLLCGKYALIDRKDADNSFYLAANMHWEPHEFALPTLANGEKLQFLFATDEDCKAPITGKTYEVPARSIVVFMGAEEKAQTAVDSGKKQRKAAKEKQLHTKTSADEGKQKRSGENKK